MASLLRRTLVLQYKSGLLACALCMLLAACNPGKQLSKAVAQRNENPPKVIYPAQHKATPAGINYVYDYEDLFTPAQEKKLDTLLRQFETSNLIPIKINTINTAVATEGASAYNQQSLKDWDVVHGRSNKSMVITVSKSLQEIKVDYGEAVKKFITKDEVAAIINAEQNLNDNNSYFNATYNIATNIMNAIRKNINFNPQPVSK